MADRTEDSIEITRPARRLHELGAGLVEYALLVALISLACLGALQVIGGNQEGSINNTASSVASAIGN